MSATNKLFLMLDEDRSYGHLVSGPDPAAAVEAHHASLDAWCAPPPDAEISEEFVVLLHEAPAHLEDEAIERFEDLHSDEFPDQVTDFCGEYPGVAAIEVNVTYTAAEGAKASLFPRLSNRFRRRGEG